MLSFHLFRPALVALVLLPVTGMAQPVPAPAGALPVPDAAACREDRMPPPPRGAPSLAPDAAPKPPMLLGLALSEAQEDQVFQIRHARAPALREAIKKARHAEEDLRGLATASGFDATRAKALAEAAGKAHGEMALLRATESSQILAVLTPVQRKQLIESALCPNRTEHPPVRQQPPR